MLLTMNEISKSAMEGFHKKYPPFREFQTRPEYTPYWTLCIEAVQDRDLLGHIVFCNDLFAIPPVKTFLCNYTEKLEEATGRGDAKLDDYTKKAIGAFWGYIFKTVFGYRGQKSVSISLNRKFMLKTATCYSAPTETIILTY